MKRAVCLSIFALILFSAVAAFAADVTGTWTGNAKGPNGEDFALTFTFKQDGAKLTGTVAGPQGDPIDITDGKVEGDNVSFNVSFGGMTITHTGVVKAADEITLKTKSDQFPESEMTLKKSK